MSKHTEMDKDAAARIQSAAARDMLPNPSYSVTSIAKLLGVSPGTLYNHIPDLKELRSSEAHRALGPAQG